MKFRYKVLITNLILLSVSLGLVGYLMIHKNFELAKETQISNAVIQNNLVQSSVEYEVLQALNREESVKGALPDIGAQVSSGMRAENVTFFIYYGDKLVYNETEENANRIPHPIERKSGKHSRRMEIRTMPSLKRTVIIIFM